MDLADSTPTPNSLLLFFGGETVASPEDPTVADRRQWMRDSVLSPGAQKLYLYLASSDVKRVTQARLARALGVVARTVKRYVVELRDENWIHVAYHCRASEYYPLTVAAHLMCRPVRRSANVIDLTAWTERARQQTADLYQRWARDRRDRKEQ